MFRNSHFYFLFIFIFLYFVFLGTHLWRDMEVPKLGVKSELLLPACARATETTDPRHVCDLYHSSPQHLILNTLSEARDRTHNLMFPSQICFHCTMMGTSFFLFYSHQIFFFSFHGFPKFWMIPFSYEAHQCLHILSDLQIVLISLSVYVLR